MEHVGSSYGLWFLVIINSVVFIFFAFSFTKPKTKRDWRTFGAFSAFIVALFVEMYGFPLTIYILSGWLTSKYPEVDFFSHNNGHLLHTFLGFKGDPHFDPLHIASMIFIFLGFILISTAWNILYQAQKKHMLATTGIYSNMRHPQYVGFISIMFGFLLQWPTLITLIMFPILVIMYLKLAKREEKEAEIEFGQEWINYKARVPAFVPKLKR